MYSLSLSHTHTHTKEKKRKEKKQNKIRVIKLQVYLKSFSCEFLTASTAGKTFLTSRCVSDLSLTRKPGLTCAVFEFPSLSLSI